MLWLRGLWFMSAVLHCILFSNSLCLSPRLHPFAGFYSLCQSVLLTLMGLDVIHDWKSQHLDKNKGQLKYVSVRVYLEVKLLPVRYARMQLYLRFTWLTCNDIQSHQRKLRVTAITLNFQN